MRMHILSPEEESVAGVGLIQLQGFEQRLPRIYSVNLSCLPVGNCYSIIYQSRV
jgi:hypothetical protein